MKVNILQVKELKIIEELIRNVIRHFSFPNLNRAIKENIILNVRQAIIRTGTPIPIDTKCVSAFIISATC